MPKIKNLKLTPQRRDHSLAEQIIANRVETRKSGVSQATTDDDDDDNFASNVHLPDSSNNEERMTARILQQAREQQSEINDSTVSTKPKKTQSKKSNGIKFLPPIQQSSKTTTQSRAFAPDNEEDSDSQDDDLLNENGADQYDEPPLVLDADDEKAWNMFLPAATNDDRKSLAVVMREKLTEKKTELDSQFSEPMSVHVQQHQRLRPDVVRMYKGVAQVLARYRSGKVPKAFKVVPRLQNWEQILYLTEPDRWSAAAMFQATRLFASNMSPKLAQRFYNSVLLPRVRDDIAENKKLNPHLHAALRKALFKPGAFFKGILLPLAESGSCTLREAVIIGLVLKRISVPMLHSAAAMLRLAEMPQYNGSSSVFLKALMEKHYALPYRVTDAVVHHFLRFSYEKRKLPVLWHQSLLAFAENYKADISSEQKEQLLDLLRYQSHYQITPEIRRLLINSRCRDLEQTFEENKPELSRDVQQKDVRVDNRNRPEKPILQDVEME